MSQTIEIYRDGIWAGRGTIDAGGHIECPAILGPDQDAAEECYEAIEGNLDAGRLVRPDGVYTWEIE